MGSSPKKEKGKTTGIETEINDILEPFFTVFGFESIKEEGFPVIDVFENAENILIEAELPGVSKNSVKVSIVEGGLVIEGEKAGVREESENVKYLCIERSFGKFRRSIEIPAPADMSKIRARYREGVLIITIPKVKEQRRKSITVEIE